MLFDILPSATALISLFALLIGYIGAFFILVGAALGTYYGLVSMFKQRSQNLQKVRIFTGQYFLIGLEFLVGKDILETILKPDLHDLVALTLLVVIRVLLGYFLKLEIKSSK